MGLLDKLQKEVKEKKKITRVQFKIPTETHEKVSKILEERGITWQSLLTNSLKNTIEEAALSSKKKT